jgi:hypothetical protein
MVMITIHTWILMVTNLNKVIFICSVVSITVGFKQTWFNVIDYPLRYQYMNQTAPWLLARFLLLESRDTSERRSAVSMNKNESR